MTVYQIITKGQYAYFSGEGKFYSQKVYRTKPSPEEISAFEKKCTTPLNDADSFFLDGDTIQTKVVELELVD